MGCTRRPPNSRIIPETVLTGYFQLCELIKDSQLEKAISVDHESTEMSRGGYDTRGGPQGDAKGHASAAATIFSLGHHGKRCRAQAREGSEPAVYREDIGGAAESAYVCMEPAQPHCCYGTGRSQKDAETHGRRRYP